MPYGGKACRNLPRGCSLLGMLPQLTPPGGQLALKKQKYKQNRHRFAPFIGFLCDHGTGRKKTV